MINESPYMKKRSYVIGIGIIVFLFIITGIITTISHNKIYNDDNHPDVPEEVSDLLDNYFSALKKGTDEAAEYIRV